MINIETLTKLLDAGFTRDEIRSMGYLEPDPQPVPAEPEPDEPAAPVPVTEPEPKPTADTAQPGLSAEQALVKLIGKLDARLSAIQSANIKNEGFEQPAQRSDVDVLSELVDPRSTHD